MAKIALLVPDESMLRQAHDALQEMKETLHIMRVIRTKGAVSEARRAANEGADIIIARGIQATLIRQYTDLPVVEIVMTVESAERLLERAKRIKGTEHPAVAFVMLRNMACPMTGLAEKVGVDLREYYVQNLEMLQDSAEQAIEDRADVLIGGASVLEIADRAGVPSLFLSTDETAMANAIREARKLAETIEPESGEDPGGKSGAGAGRSGAAGGNFPDRAGGASAKKRKEPFVNFLYRSEKMQDCVDLAAALSRSECPKLIIEEAGNLRKAFASAIHNHCPCSGEQMVPYTAVPGGDAFEDLFGRKGIFMVSGKGTVELNDPEHLDTKTQRRLQEMLMFRHVICVTSCPEEKLKELLIPELFYRLSAFLIRIPSLDETPEDIPLLTDSFMKSTCEKHGKYHVLEKRAREYIASRSWTGNRMQLASFLERLVLTAEKRIIRKEETERLWELLYEEKKSRYCERRNGTAGGAQGNWNTKNAMNTEDAFFSGDEWTPEEQIERDKILAALGTHFGRREKAAEELGISTTTLWRKLKKYRISG